MNAKQTKKLVLHKLTNKDIHDNYQDYKWYLTVNDFLAAFSYTVVDLNNNRKIPIKKSLKAFRSYIEGIFGIDDLLQPVEYSYKSLSIVLDENRLAEIPEILELNTTYDPDNISIGALSRNMFYLILRLKITQESLD